MVMSKTDTNDNETEAMTKQQWYHEKRNEKKKKNQKSTSCKKKTEKMSRHRYKGLSEKEKK